MPPAAEVGSTANSYEILAKLAVGGMAEIFLARGASVAGVSRYVVLKRILRHRASDVQFVRMFLDEARLAAQLQHPNIAQVHDIGRLGDSYFFTMEYVHGETVRALLHRAHALRRQTPIGCVMTIIAGAAQGLHHAHERNGMDGRPLGIVHRDVSPSNLMVSYEGNIKVVDFGVAKAADRVSETRSGTVKGKISYLCPEQCRGAEVDRRGDLYSLGTVLWELLTTHRLYKRASDFENMTAIVNDPVPPPSQRRADCPPELDALTLKLMAKRPEDRFQTGEEVVEALEAVAARCGFVLSTSALGRYVREVFGTRPLPWMAPDGQPPPGGVTVTGLPVPAELAIPVADSVDNALLHVADLSAQPGAGAMFGTGSQSGSADALDALPSASAPPPQPQPPPQLPQPHAYGMAPPPTAATWAPGMQPTTLRPSQPSLHAPEPTSGVTPYPAAFGLMPPTAASRSELRTLPPRAKWRVPVAVWILAPAALIGVVLGLVMSTRDDTIAGFPAPRAPAAATVASDAAEPAATPSDDAAAAVVAAVPAPLDAAVAAAPVHADAAVAVAVRADAAVAVAVAPPPPPPLSEADRQLAALAAAEPANLVAACAALAGKLAAEPARRCTLAACRAHREPEAKRWLAGVIGAKRGQVLSSCASAGTPLERAATRPDCATDPMACQH